MKKKGESDSSIDIENRKSNSNSGIKSQNEIINND